jgi:branched-chain amino acid transport system permease protein
VVGELQRRRAILTQQLPWINLILGAIVLVALLQLVLRIVEAGPSYFLQILSYGIANGSIYALVALGYTMVYGIIELINFAHGDVFTLGAFFSLMVIPVFGLEAGRTGLELLVPLLAVFLICMLACGVVNVTIERVAYRPLRKAPRLAPLITAVGVSFVLEGLMYLWKGPFNIRYPDLLPRDVIQVGGAAIGYKEIIVTAIAVILVGALSIFIERSRLGKAMRATAQDHDAAQLMGINLDRTIAATFFIGALLAGAGGIIWGLYYNNVVFDLGFHAGLVAFTAAVFGGIGNIHGAALGGLLIGIIGSFSDGYFDSTWTQVIIFSILILVLVFRPTGLLGMRVPEK